LGEIVTLAEVGELERVLERSRERPVWLFKHSLTCGVSARARREYQRFVAANGEGADFTLLEIQRARPLSRVVVEATGVRHASPQAILLRDGRAVWHASHSGITVERLATAAG